MLRWLSWTMGLTLVLLVFFVPGVAGCSTQPSWPTKSIELVVSFAAGGGSDVVARVAAKHLSAELGVPVNVVNRAGGNSIPAVLSVLSAPPDGYTLLLEQQANSSLHGILKDLPYKVEDRTFGPMLVGGPQAFAVNGKSPLSSLKDVADFAKKDPGSFTWGRLGGTSMTDFANLQFFSEAGIDVSKTKPVAFDGAGPAMNAIAGGHLIFGSTGAGAVFPLKASGDIKVLAIIGDQRLASLPDVPSTKEAGYPGVNVMLWFGLSGPKGLPQPIIDRLDRAAKKLVDDPNYGKDLLAVANQPKYMAPNQILPLVKKEIEMFNALASGIRMTK